MIAKKNLSLLQVIQFTGVHILWLSLWSGTVITLYHVYNLHWLKLPWLPMSLVGTALAFYVGFKNNAAYDRMWEARKIWGAIINSSRAWGTTSRAYISNFFTENPVSEDELSSIKQKLIYRHIAWLYVLRKQLLKGTEWEHINQEGFVGKNAERYQQKHGIGMVEDEVTHIYNNLKCKFSEGELTRISQCKNMATQMIEQQSQDLAQLRELDIIDDFRHMELQKILNDFYIHQGKCERIKKYPLPRQYASMSYHFVLIFILLLPLGMVSQFSEMGQYGIWLSMPFSTLIGWIFFSMELVGDYSENPFQGMANDIPMLSLCRVIEIDLREMLGETDLPAPIQSKNGILM